MVNIFLFIQGLHSNRPLLSEFNCLLTLQSPGIYHPFSKPILPLSVGLEPSLACHQILLEAQELKISRIIMDFPKETYFTHRKQLKVTGGS